MRQEERKSPGRGRGPWPGTVVGLGASVLDLCTVGCLGAALASLYQVSVADSFYCSFVAVRSVSRQCQCPLATRSPLGWGKSSSPAQWVSEFKRWFCTRF
jgi:hypothetical protein